MIADVDSSSVTRILTKPIRFISNTILEEIGVADEWVARITVGSYHDASLLIHFRSIESL